MVSLRLNMLKVSVFHMTFDCRVYDYLLSYWGSKGHEAQAILSHLIIICLGKVLFIASGTARVKIHMGWTLSWTYVDSHKVLHHRPSLSGSWKRHKNVPTKYHWWWGPACWQSPHRKHGTLSQCWFDVGPKSQTLGQHQTNIGSLYPSCWAILSWLTAYGHGWWLCQASSNYTLETRAVRPAIGRSWRNTSCESVCWLITLRTLSHSRFVTAPRTRCNGDMLWCILCVSTAGGVRVCPMMGQCLWDQSNYVVNNDQHWGNWNVYQFWGMIHRTCETHFFRVIFR